MATASQEDHGNAGGRRPCSQEVSWRLVPGPGAWTPRQVRHLTAYLKPNRGRVASKELAEPCGASAPKPKDL